MAAKTRVEKRKELEGSGAVKKEFDTLRSRAERLIFNYDKVVLKLKACTDQAKKKEYNDILVAYRNRMNRKAVAERRLHLR